MTKAAKRASARTKAAQSARPTRARSSNPEFRNHAVVELLGIRMLSVTRKRILAEMAVSASHTNPNGRVNGGIIMAFADVVGARGAVANLPPGARTSTIESKTNFFAAGAGPCLKGESLPLHIGRTTMVWQTSISNADGRRVALVTQTQIVIPGASRGMRIDPPSPQRVSRPAGDRQVDHPGQTRRQGTRLGRRARMGA
ncbi:MAG: PaaI family thioesterase [Burkholderiales bacterium]|nr:PaaI family thioesterase [Burkholderiales bacterium]